MTLAELLGPEQALAPPAALALPVQGLTADSRAAAPGFVFAALAGARTDGRRFIADAVAKGAIAVVAGTEAEIDASVPVVRTSDPRRTLALMAARFHKLQPQTAVAVTGTSGKTSVAEFTRQIFAKLGRKAASLGTIGVVKPDGAVYGALTTPDPVSLHDMLAGLAREGITHLAFEASSHGLDQRRLDGVRLTAAAFTNLGHDHLDYHPSVDAYLAAKIRLFDTLLEPGRTAVINADGARAADVEAAARRRGLKVFTTGEQGRDLRLSSVTRDGFAQRLEIAHGGRTMSVRLPLIGAYQAANALVAAGLAIAAGEPVEQALAALEGLAGVKGRLEVVAHVRGGIAVVDYAHKPDALAAVLTALRPFATGRLMIIVGCGGDRDRLKRPIMGRIAVEGSDIVIITDDNPRSEDPAAIRRAVLAGAPGAREIGDRGTAIREGVRLIGPGDVLLVAGKGHETGQIVGSVTLPFSDHEAIASAVQGA